MPHDNDQSRVLLPRPPQIDNPFQQAAIERWQEDPQQGVDAPQPSSDTPQPSADAPEVEDDNRGKSSADAHQPTADAPQPSADAPEVEDDNQGKGSADAPQLLPDVAEVANHNKVSNQVWKVLVKILDTFSD